MRLYYLKMINFEFSSYDKILNRNSETLDRSGLSRTDMNQTESVNGDDSASELVLEPTVQEEDVGDASQASEPVSADYSDGEGAADEPAVSMEKTKI